MPPCGYSDNSSHTYCMSLSKYLLRFPYCISSTVLQILLLCPGLNLTDPMETSWNTKSDTMTRSNLPHLHYILPS